MDGDAETWMEMLKPTNQVTIFPIRKGLVYHPPIGFQPSKICFFLQGTRFFQENETELLQKIISAQNTFQQPFSDPPLCFASPKTGSIGRQDR